MSNNNILTASIVIPVTIGIGGLIFYAMRKPKTDAEKHLEQVKQNPTSNVIFDSKIPKFATFGGSTRRHKKGNKHTKKRAKH